MTKEKLMSMIYEYGDLCETFGDYQSEENALKCNKLYDEILDAVEQIFAERGEK